MRNVFLLVVALLGALARTSVAWSSGSAPVLTLTGGDGIAASNGARAVVVTGSFNFDDRLQFGFPVGVLVVQGEHVVRYDVSGTIVSATSVLVTDGVVAAEIPALLTLTGDAAAPARVVQIRPDRITVALPPEIGAGPASVLLYASKDSEPFVSNAVELVLP